MYFETHVNFFSYGSFGGLKSNFGGHDIHHHDNIYTYINEGFHVGGSAVQEKGHNNMFSTMMVTMVLGKYVQEMVNSLCMITKSILPMVKLPSVGRSRSYEAPSGASGVQDLPPAQHIKTSNHWT